MLFAVGRENAGRLYFADLLGASLGALAVTFLLSWLGGETADPRGLARAARGRRPLRPALPRPLRGGGAARPRRGRRQRADGPLQDPQRSHQGPLSAHGGDPGLEDRAHRLERLLAHRRRDRLRVALPRPPLHRLRRVDEHPRVGRQRRQRRGHARVVPRAAVQGRAGAAEDAHHRPRRRLGRAGGPRRRIREGDRGRDEPAHAPLRPPLRRAGRQPLRPPAGRGDPLRGAHLHPARRPLLRRDPHGLRGLVGGGRLGRALALREPPLHGRGLPGVPRSPDARRRARHPALGRGRAAARVERGGPPRPGGGRPARGRPAREAAGRPRGPAADDLHAQEAALERRGNGTDGLVAGSRAGDRAGPARRGALRVALLGKDELRRLRGPGEDARRPRLRRPALLLRAGEAVGPAGRHEAGLPLDPRPRPRALRPLPGLRQAEGRARGPLRRARSRTSRASASASSPWSCRCCST